MITTNDYMPNKKNGAFDRISNGVMFRARGDILRLADLNIPVPESIDEVGLFAVPFVVQSTGATSFALVDGLGNPMAYGAMTHLVLWIVRNYNDKACLTDCARALL